MTCCRRDSKSCNRIAVPRRTWAISWGSGPPPRRGDSEYLHPIDLIIDKEKIGKYFLDFLIEDKLILELKAKPSFTKNDYRQVLAYLTAANLKLGILANFYAESLEYKRILNSKYKDN